MAADKHTIKIVDKDGNQSEVTLPGFAMDSTQEKLIKSVQALGKMNPKTAKAYEELIDATKKQLTSTTKASEQQKKDAKDLQNTVQSVGDKQVSALRQFRMNFADRVGKDMRDTFVTGGNILTAAIKTATVGLAAGAGLLYKTFMDTSDAFRTLAQSGLGGGGVTGTEAQEAVANLTRLGMSASEAASMLTSFGRASAVLGKANFSKFVAGIAGSTSFAAELGLTLNEAAEFAAEEIDMRQRAMAGRMQLDAFTEASIKENIRLTQSMSTLFGRSMKDIQQAKQNFLTQNAQLATLMLRLPANISEKAVKEISDMLTIAGGFSADIEQFMTMFLNAGASAIPMADSTVQQLMGLGSVGTQFKGEIDRFNKEIQNGSVDARRTMLRLVDMLAQGGEKSARLLSILEQSGDPVAGMIARAARDAQQGGEQLRNAMLGIGPAMDPMIESGTRLRNTLSEVQGAFTTFALQALGGLATPLNEFMRALTDTGLTEEQQRIAAEEVKAWEKRHRLSSNASDAEIEAYKVARQAKINEAYQVGKNTSIVKVFSDTLNDVGKTFLKVFFGDITPNAEEFGKKLREDLIPWITETATSLKQWLKDLEGKTFGEKIKALLSGLVTTVIAPAIATVMKETLWAFFTSPAGWAAVGGLILLSVTKSLVLSGLASLITTRIGGSAATTAGAVKSAGNTLALAIRQVAMAVRRAGAGLGVGGPMGPMGGPDGGSGGRGGRFGRFMRGMGGKASLAGIVAGVGGMYASDALNEAGHTKTATAVDIGTQALGMAGTGAMLGSFFGPVGTAVGAIGGGLIGGGMAAWSAWSQSKEAEQAMAEKGQEAIEGMDATGMSAMAMDPQHIRNVSMALQDFNKISVNNIANGLSKLTPQLTNLFTTMEGSKDSFVFIEISRRLERLVAVLTNFNIEGAKLPTTTEYLVNLSNQINAMQVEPIIKLASAFSALTTALKDFGELTTSTFFSRMMDGFTGRQDETANIIKTLNDFADKVETTKLADAAAAIQSFTTAIANVARPTEVERASPAGGGSPPANASTTANPMAPDQGNSSSDRIESTLRRIEVIMNRHSTTLTSIKENTEPKRRS